MPKSIVTLNIAANFSREPAGRYRSDGPHSGEVFREDYLIPALKSSSAVEVVFDGTEGYGSSFLEEAFGGLLRHFDIDEGGFRERVVLKSDDDPTLIDEVMGYVSDEARRKSSHHGRKG